MKYILISMIVSKIVMVLMIMLMTMAIMNDVGSNDDKMKMTRRSNDGDNTPYSQMADTREKTGA